MHLYPVTNMPQVGTLSPLRLVSPDGCMDRARTSKVDKMQSRKAGRGFSPPARREAARLIVLSSQNSRVRRHTARNGQYCAPAFRHVNVFFSMNESRAYNHRPRKYKTSLREASYLGERCHLSAARIWSCRPATTTTEVLFGDERKNTS